MIRPLRDLVILRRLPAPAESAGGITLPDPEAAERGQAARFEVLSVGAGRWSKEGVFLSTTVRPGDVVLVDPRFGDELPGERGLRAVTEPQILGLEA